MLETPIGHRPPSRAVVSHKVKSDVQGMQELQEVESVRLFCLFTISVVSNGTQLRRS